VDSSICQDAAPPKNLAILTSSADLGSAAVADGLGAGSSVDAGPISWVSLHQPLVTGLCFLRVGIQMRGMGQGSFRALLRLASLEWQGQSRAALQQQLQAWICPSTYLTPAEALLSWKGESSAGAEIDNKCLLHTHGVDDTHFGCPVTGHQDSIMTLCKADTHATSMPCVTPAYLFLGNKLVSRMHTACIPTTCRQELCFSSHCFIGVYSNI